MKRFIAYALLAIPCTLACGPTAPGGTGGTGAVGGTGGKGGTGGTGAIGGTGGTGGGAQNLPCDVAAAMTVCRTCHTGIFPQQFSLLTYAAVKARATDVSNAVSGGIMPPFGATPLTAAQKTTIISWVAAGAPAFSGTCN
jgi:hypothetical protein